MISPNAHPGLPLLAPNRTPGAAVEPLPGGGYHLEIPAGAPGQYRLAQLDDYHNLQRRDFPWSPPFRLQVRARASANVIPGTWGFGVWNDPLSLKLGFGSGRRLPVLPNAAWFFFASPSNYLSLQDDLPAYGPLAGTFSAANLSAALLGLGALAAPLLAFPGLVRGGRRIARRFVRQSAISFAVDATEWHHYQLEWDAEQTRFSLDQQPLLETAISPRSRLGLVIWIDNQYLALPPDGRLRFGTLGNPSPAWIEVEHILVG